MGGFRRKDRACRAVLCSGTGLMILAAGAVLMRAAQDQSHQLPTIQPAELARVLRQSGNKPLLLQVGYHTLYEQAHIPGSEYCGPASTREGMAKFRDCVRTVPKKTEIVIYCGCCPWQHCPNVHPAYKELERLGFAHVQVLYIADNLGRDWVEKGYPIVRGR